MKLIFKTGKVRKRILAIRRQSRIRLPKENLWYYSEESALKQSPVYPENVYRKDRTSILHEDLKVQSLSDAGRSRYTKDPLFIVDWQMSDVY